MLLGGQKFDFELLELSTALTIPDCFVVRQNKLGTGNGEAKLYFGMRTEMLKFFDNSTNARCILLRQDLLDYMEAIRGEYYIPTQPYTLYREKGRNAFRKLWNERLQDVKRCEDVIEFDVQPQFQIRGPRGYINSKSGAYKLLRQIALPETSFLSVMKVRTTGGSILYYWKMFVDFEAIKIRRQGRGPYAFSYGKQAEVGIVLDVAEPALDEYDATDGGKNVTAERAARDGQQEYRKKLLQECPYCPITRITDERLLIASHIKPWAVAEEKEKTDPSNGFILSPLYDKLFDQGFLTFTSDRRMKVSNWLSPNNMSNCNLKDGQFIQDLPLTEKREFYLEYHRKYVFKG